MDIFPGITQNDYPKLRPDISFLFHVFGIVYLFACSLFVLYFYVFVFVFVFQGGGGIRKRINLPLIGKIDNHYPTEEPNLTHVES
jgi:hypothetical protein